MWLYMFYILTLPSFVVYKELSVFFKFCEQRNCDMFPHQTNGVYISY
jgi:hypothetical protein